MVKLWDAMTGQEIVTLKGHRRLVTCVAISPDSARIVSASFDGTAKLWDADTGQETLTLTGQGAVVSVAFSPDGARIAAPCGDSIVRVWDARPATPELLIEREARDLVKFLVAKDLSKEAMAMRLRDNQTINDVVRKNALSLVEPYWKARVRLKLSSLVASLFDKLLLQSEVMQAIRQEPTLGEELRDEALAEAARTLSNPFRLNEASWAVVRQVDADEAAYRRALRYAEAASQLLPDNGLILNTLGVAQYRAGQYAAALETLMRADKINSMLFNGSIPPDLAFLAMAQQQLGQPALARATLTNLRESLKNPRWGNDGENQAFQREAEALIIGHRANAME
jgi:tetratricopeptide (TPR) repeat protein